jgi:hypothetical protein
MSATTMVDLKPVMDASHLARSMSSMPRRLHSVEDEKEECAFATR